MEENLYLMVNGLPGSMATEVVKAARNSEDIGLIGVSLTGPDIRDRVSNVDGLEIELYRPENAEAAVGLTRALGVRFIAVDFTQPEAVNGNADFYNRHGIPFVIGTTGGDRKQLLESVASSGNSAVVAPNMAKQIVAFQEYLSGLSEDWPGLLEGCSLDIVESHQKAKADTSGTAKAMVENPDRSPGIFPNLGIDYTIDQIHDLKIRDPEMQRALGVPSHYMEGHGWHNYIITSDEPNHGIDQMATEMFDFLRLDPDEAFTGYTLSESIRPESKSFPNLELLRQRTGHKDLAKSVDRAMHRVSGDGNITFSALYTPDQELILLHNVNGRQIYAQGALDAARFLASNQDAGRAYTMKNVLGF